MKDQQVMDGEFDEDSPSATENVKAAFQRKDVKNKVMFKIGIVAAAAAVAATLIYRQQSSAPTSAMPQQYSGVNTGTPADDPQPLDQKSPLAATASPDQNPAVRSAINGSDQALAEAERTAGRSATPTLDGFTPPAQPGASQPQAGPAAPIDYAQVQAEAQARAQAQQAAAGLYGAYLKKGSEVIVGLMKPQEGFGSETRVMMTSAAAAPSAGPANAPPSYLVPRTDSAADGAAKSAEQAGVTHGAAAVKKYTLVEAASLYAGETINGFNSVNGSSTMAIALTTGPMAGARILATVQRNGETGIFQLKSLTIPGKNITVPASGLVLDASSLEQGYATDVDRKVMMKYVIKPVIGGLAAAGKAIQAMGTTSTNGVLGSTTQAAVLSGRQVGQVVVGGAAEAIAKDGDAINTDPVVKIAPRSIVGVMFDADVIYAPESQ